MKNGGETADGGVPPGPQHQMGLVSSTACAHLGRQSVLWSLAAM